MDVARHFKWGITLVLLVNAAAMLSPIINSGDAVTYATLAQHIALGNDWTRLVLDGQDWLDKPHLPFWITALFFQLGGVSAFTYILPGFLFHLLGAYYTYRLARLLYDRQTALLAVLVYVSVFNLMDASIEIKAETYLIGEIMPACYYWLRYDARFSVKHLLLGALFTALAVMTKGIFTLFTIASGLALLWVYQRQWRKFYSLKWLGALALSLAFVAPELIALQMQFSGQAASVGGEPVSAIRFFFWDSQFGRFLNTGPIQNRNGHPLYFVLVFLWAFLPWTWISLAAVRAQIKGMRAAPAPERAAFVFLAAAFSATFLMFSATKFQLDYYIDIIFPFAAILCARYLASSGMGRRLFIAQMGFLGFLALLAVGLTVYVGNAIILGVIGAQFVGLALYIRHTWQTDFAFRAAMYSALSITVTYAFLVLLTALTFVRYSLPYNVVQQLEQQPALPVYVYQMPEAERELALYCKTPYHAIDALEAAQKEGGYYLVIRHEQAEQLRLDPARYSKVAAMQLVVHKTGPFNRLLQLARGAGPLEGIDVLAFKPR